MSSNNKNTNEIQEEIMNEFKKVYELFYKQHLATTIKREIKTKKLKVENENNRNTNSTSKTK